MRALFIRPNLAAGGAERHASILLPGLRERGIDARLIALDGGGPFESELRRRGVPLDVLNMRNQLDAPRLLHSRLMRTFAPDVVVTQGVSGLYVGYLVARVRGAAHIYNDHRGAGLVFSQRREAMLRLMAGRLDAVIAVSGEQSAGWVARGCPRERIVVIANGVQFSPTTASRAQLRHGLGLDDHAVAALLVATLRPEKRAHDFVEAVTRAHRANSNVVGLVAGDGPERPTVQALADRGQGVRLLGYRDDVADLTRAADIFVLTSEHEAVPMAILEAMAAGLPVLATRVGDIPSVVVHGESGWLVPAGDVEAMAARLLELAADSQLRTTLGAAGARRHRDRFDAATMIDAYADALHRSVAVRRSG